MSLPRLHVVTDDAVLARDAFCGTARALAERFGESLALHVRGHRTPVRLLYERTAALAEVTAVSGTLLLVADRVDVALGVGRGVGIRLGALSMSVAVARSLVGPGRVLGYSAHGRDEAVEAVQAGADFVVLGTIWVTASHPDRPGAGPSLIRESVGAVAAPVVAIGGVTPERAGAARSAGAHGVAVLRGVWEVEDPVEAAGEYLERLE